MTPTFLTQLADPAVRTVLLCGCGGGFDFVHGLTLYGELVRMGKAVVIGSYSFGHPEEIGEPAPIVFREGDVIAKCVSARSRPDPHYGPEVHVASWLDERYPEAAPHEVYAYYARAFTVSTLRRLYAQLVEEHDVDAIVLFDGGSDSLMVGDEEGLGDPIEDAVSVGAVASLPRPSTRILVSIGLGADRFNHVSDAASLRAVAELTAAGGFLGALALEPGSDAHALYRGGIEHIYARQSFRSALTGFILSATEGCFGGDEVPPVLASRVRPGGFFVWPLMAMLWAFDVTAVARRSRIVEWIADCTTPREALLAVAHRRAQMGLRPVEDLPRHVTMRNPDGRFL